MTKRALFLILTGMLCASVALAGKTNNQRTFTLNGQWPGADLYFSSLTSESGGSGYFNAHMYPEQLEDGSMGYYAKIGWNDGISSGEICGHVPASAVKSKGLWGPIQVNISQDSFTDSDSCIWSVNPTDFHSLTGTFTVYTGPGSSKTVETGTYTWSETLPDGTPKIEESFKGASTDQGASFQGTFVDNNGPFTVAVDGASGGAEMFVQVGTMTVGPDL